MSATVAQLGARALRKLGIAIVADASRPAARASMTTAQVAAGVLLQRGIPVAEANRPASLGIIARMDIAARALRAVGVNPAPLEMGTGTGTVYTMAQAATEALLKLSVFNSEDTGPSPADQAHALKHASIVHDTLVALDYVTWGPNAIPAAAFEYYIAMTAQLIAPSFGKPASIEVYQAMREMVRQLALSGAYAQTLAEQKVDAVHEELNAMGLVSWAVTAIPIACESYYTELTRLMLWPIYKPETAEDRKLGIEAHGMMTEAVRRVSVVRGMQARAEAAVIAAHEEINALGFATWDANAIPASAVYLYANLASNQLGEEGGKEEDPADHAMTLSRIRRIAMGGPAGQALAEQKVRAVHYSLEARGRTRWTLFDIPDFAEEPYVLMAATLLAPEVGEKADPAWAEMAERDLMRIVSLPSQYEPVRVDYF